MLNLFEELVENGPAGIEINTVQNGTYTRGPMLAEADDARVIEITSDSSADTI